MQPSRPHFSPERPLFYIHIPKVGGSSLEVLLENQFPAGATERLAHHPDHRDSLQHRRFTERSCYYGHVPYRFRDLLPAGNTAFTFLRDPIDRTLSVFYYWRSLGRDGLIREGVPSDLLCCCDLTLGEFIKKVPQARRVLGDVQTWQMGWPQPFVGGTPPEPKAILEQAIRNLDGLAFIGLTERMDQSVAALCRLFGWYAPPVAPHVNRTPVRPPAAALDPETRATLEEWTSLDAELYRHAVARHDAQMANLPTWPPLPVSAEVEFTGEGPMAGWGWHRREHGPAGWYRWTMQRSGVEVRVAGGGEIRLTLDVLSALDPAQLTGLTVLLDDRPLRLTRTQGAHGGTRFTGSLSGVPQGETTYRVEIRVPEAIRPADRDPNCRDVRPLGVAVSRLHVGFRKAGLWARLWGAA